MRVHVIVAVLAVPSTASILAGANEVPCVRHPVHKQCPCAKATHTHLAGWNTFQLSSAPEKVCIARDSQVCRKEVLNPHLYHSCAYFGPLGQGCGK